MNISFVASVCYFLMHACQGLLMLALNKTYYNDGFRKLTFVLVGSVRQPFCMKISILRLSWPRWFSKYRNGLAATRQSPNRVVTGQLMYRPRATSLIESNVLTTRHAANELLANWTERTNRRRCSSLGTVG